MTYIEALKQFNFQEIELAIEKIKDCTKLLQDSRDIAIEVLRMFADMMKGNSISPSITKEKIAKTMDVAIYMGKISSESAEEHERWDMLADFLKNMTEFSCKK